MISNKKRIIREKVKLPLPQRKCQIITVMNVSTNTIVKNIRESRITGGKSKLQISSRTAFKQTNKQMKSVRKPNQNTLKRQEERRIRERGKRGTK